MPPLSRSQAASAHSDRAGGGHENPAASELATEPAAGAGSARSGKWIGADMKEVLSLTTFAIGALCFVVFVTTVKPQAISAVPASSKPEYCKMQALVC
jgi:hypothetical protein